VCDFHFILSGNFQVGVYIALGINYDGHTCLLAADEITGLSQAFVINVLKVHIGS
jgi:hypothetical protein